MMNAIINLIQSDFWVYYEKYFITLIAVNVSNTLSSRSIPREGCVVCSNKGEEIRIINFERKEQSP